MGNKSRKLEIDSVLYALERMYGLQAFFVARSTSVDLDTGAVTPTETATEIPYAITFEEERLFSVNSQIGQLFSSQVEVGDRFLISRKYFQPDEEDFIVFDSKRFEIVDWVELDAKAGIIFQIRHKKQSTYTLNQNITVAAYVNAT